MFEILIVEEIAHLMRVVLMRIYYSSIVWSVAINYLHIYTDSDLFVCICIIVGLRVHSHLYFSITQIEN